MQVNNFDIQNPQLFVKVSKFLGNENIRFWSLFETIEELLNVAERNRQEYTTLFESVAEANVMIMELQEEVKQYKLHESILLERLQKQTLQIKEMKQNSRLQRFYSMAEENLKMAQKKGQLESEVKVQQETIERLENLVKSLEDKNRTLAREGENYLD